MRRLTLVLLLMLVVVAAAVAAKPARACNGIFLQGFSSGFSIQPSFGSFSTPTFFNSCDCGSSFVSGFAVPSSSFLFFSQPQFFTQSFSFQPRFSSSFAFNSGGCFRGGGFSRGREVQRTSFRQVSRFR